MTLEFHPYPILQTTQPQAQEQEQQQFNSLNRTLENMAQTAQTQRQRNFENPILQAQNDRAQRTSDLEHKNAVDLQNAFSDMNPNHTLGTTVNAPQGGASTDGTPPGGTPWGGNVGPSQSDMPGMGAAPGTYPGTPQPSMQPQQQPDMADFHKSLMANAGPKSMFGARNPAEFDLKSKMFNMGQEADKNAADINLKNAQAKSLSQRDPMAEFKLKTGEKEDQYNQKRFQKLSESIDPSKQRQGAFGASKQVFDRAERLESLAHAFPDGNLDSRHIEELAIGLNAMLSGSNTGAQSQVAALVPKTVWGNTRKLVEFLTNNPQGMQQQEFVRRMLSSISREKQTAQSQINRTQFSRVAPYADLEKIDPATFNEVLQSQGVSLDEYHSWKKGGFKPISAVPGPDNQGGSAQPVQIGRFKVVVH